MLPPDRLVKLGEPVKDNYFAADFILGLFVLFYSFVFSLSFFISFAFFLLLLLLSLSAFYLSKIIFSIQCHICPNIAIFNPSRTNNYYHEPALKHLSAGITSQLQL